MTHHLREELMVSGVLAFGWPLAFTDQTQAEEADSGDVERHFSVTSL